MATLTVSKKKVATFQITKIATPTVSKKKVVTFQISKILSVT